LIKIKRNADVINAVKKVTEKIDKKIHLIFIGDGEEKDELVKLS